MSEVTSLEQLVETALQGLGRVAVAVSGGIDSVTLLTLAVRAGVDVCTIHVDHGLRPDSGADAEFCARLAASLGVPHEVVRVAVSPGNSTQGRARVQRYAALVRAAARLGADAIATAHHAGDAVETALLQGARGGGPVAVAGPRARSAWAGFPLVRPLLGANRAQIEAAAAQLGVQWREDPTNAKTDYERNRIRHEVIPKLTEAAPDMAAAHDEARRLEDVVTQLTEIAVEERAPLRRMLRRDVLREAAPEVSARLLLDQSRTLYGELGRDAALAAVAAIADAATECRRFCGRQVVVEVDAEHVVVEATRGQGTRLLDARVAVPAQWRPRDGELVWYEHRLRVTEDPARAAFAVPADAVLTVRGPRPGDRIRAPGIDRSRKILDILADAHIPRASRWRWPCIWSNGRCIWVAGVEMAPNLGEHLLPPHAFSGIFVQSCTFPLQHFEVWVDTKPPESNSVKPERR